MILGVVASAVVTGFDPFSLIGWYAAAWADDPSWTNPGDGNAVSSWRDGSGNSRTLTQATGVNQPLFRASVASLNNRPALQFDGSNDALSTPTFTSQAVPWCYVVVAKVDSIVNNTYIIAGSDSGIHVMTAGSNHLNLFNANGPDAASTLTADTSGHFINALVNGGTSHLGRDGVEQAMSTGSIGTTQLHLAAYQGSAAFCACHIAFAGIYIGNVTAHANWATFKAGIATHYGLTIA